MTRAARKFKLFGNDGWTAPCVGDYVEFCVSSADKLYTDDDNYWNPSFHKGATWAHGVVTDLCRETLYSGIDNLSWEILCDDGEIYEVSSNEFVGKVINFHPIRTLRRTDI